MRELTFKGFLGVYVKQLSKQNTKSLYKLAREAATINPRLAEPLLLYAMLDGKELLLLRATKNSRLYGQYSLLINRYTISSLYKSFEENSGDLPEEYHKVWRSYMSRRNRGKADDHTKELMRKKVKVLQERKKISNYRIYTDLNLNPGNLNAWLKYGVADKVSLDTARRALDYVQNINQ